MTWLVEMWSGGKWSPYIYKFATREEAESFALQAEKQQQHASCPVYPHRAVQRVSQ